MLEVRRASGDLPPSRSFSCRLFIRRSLAPVETPSKKRRGTGSIACRLSTFSCPSSSEGTHRGRLRPEMGGGMRRGFVLPPLSEQKSSRTSFPRDHPASRFLGDTERQNDEQLGKPRSYLHKIREPDAFRDTSPLPRFLGHTEGRSDERPGRPEDCEGSGNTRRPQPSSAGRKYFPVLARKFGTSCPRHSLVIRRDR